MSSAEGPPPSTEHAEHAEHAAPRRQRPTSVYVHFPYCIKRCPYCDFATRQIDRPAIPHRRYADAVLEELAIRGAALEGRSLYSIFFGGGTPSLWHADELGRVVAGIRGAFGAKCDDVEVTVECNPSSLDAAHARALAAVGVNRLSIGVQSLAADQLEFLGRCHDGSGALRSLAEARRAVDRVSVDLMFGMEHQDADQLCRTIERLVAEGVEHVSAYALTVEAGTPFGTLARKGRLPLADEDSYAHMFRGAAATFASLGFEHYEVSNYARPGAEARHNQHYWRGGAYLGLGAAAVGCLDEGTGSARRYRNEPDPERYIARSAGALVESSQEDLGPDELIREALMLGLRTREGVDVAETERRSGRRLSDGRERALARRRERGDLHESDGRLRVPHDRWLHLDSIVSDLF